MPEVTAEHVKYFAERCRYWQREFGLTSWRLYVDQHEDETSLASADGDDNALIFKVMLSTEWNEPVTQEALDATAFHEIAHVLLRPLVELAEAHGSERDIERIEHAVIHRLSDAALGNA